MRTKCGEEESSSLDKFEMLVGVTSGEGQLGVWSWSMGACDDGLGLGAQGERRAED